MKAFQVSAAIAFLIGLGGCGTVSEMTAAEGGDEPVLPLYDTAVVLDFTDATTPKTKDEEKLAAHREEMAVASPHFADLIAAELRTNELYETVLREPYEGDALRISGEITRYAEGSAAARLFIGLGAGSSYFDSKIVFSDNRTGEKLAEMIVDKNSWALGGGIAAGQTVEGYMQAAAQRVAEEIIETRETIETYEKAKKLQQPGT